jgi:DNA-binding transcriptional MocR family regulator
MPADPIRRTIKLGPAAHELRRHVGPTTWVVLEEMLQRSTGDDHVVAQVSIRSLASSLGLAKDTVTRAVGRLRDLGVIDASQARAGSGVFEAGSYRLAVPAVCLSPAGPQLAGPSQPSALSPAPRPSCAAPPSAARSSSAARPSPPARRSSGQLSLLPEV